MSIGPVMSCYLDEMVKHSSSDMYLTVGCKPSVRKNHTITTISDSPLQPQDIRRFIDEILDSTQKNEFETRLELNISLTREDGSRYRVNFLKQQEHSAMVIRRITMVIPTIESLGLPEVYTKAIMQKRGLIIMASPGGSGKSTSMAAMLGYRNKHGSGHILTIEDPIEFVHKHGSCIFTQREIGTDTHSYAAALRNALRQRADVIAIGEIRDKETLEHALRFSETGHLCIATLHSNNSHQALTRMVNLFPDDARQYVLATIAQNLISIFSQRLVVTVHKELTVVSEILLNEGLIKTLITDNRLNEVKELMERSKDSGMQTFDQAIYKLYDKGVISSVVAIDEADNPATIKLKITQSRQDLSGTHLNMLDNAVF
jgi:twitching motility protein PilU